MHPSKTPGPASMSALFFQKYWDIVGSNVTKVVMNFLQTGIMPSKLNHTWVTLIPKVKAPVSMKDLHPISLCNVIYKVISKVLANRLKLILLDIIHPT